MDKGYAEVLHVINNKKAPFKKHQNIELIAQSFDKEKITVRRKGKEINVYDWAQSTKGQNDFYKTLDAYNGDFNLTVKQLSEYGQKIEPELLGIKSLEDISELSKQANNLWTGLPLEIRQQFRNSKDNFIKNGLNWIKTKNQEYQNLLKKEQAKLEMQMEDMEA